VELQQKIQDAGFEIEATLWMNAVGMVGWFVNSRVLNRQTIPVGQIDAFERMVPIARFIDKWATPLVGGLSLICVARRPLAS
jgi:hypothetical protein